MKRYVRDASNLPVEGKCRGTQMQLLCLFRQTRLLCIVKGEETGSTREVRVKETRKARGGKVA